MYEISSESPETVDFDRVKRIEGFERIKTEYPDYLSDESKYTAGAFEWLFFPKTEGELAAVLQEMGRRKTPVTVSAARTGLVGGCVPAGGALVSLVNLNRILAVYRDDRVREWQIRAETGVTLAELNKVAMTKVFSYLGQNGGEELQSALEQFKKDPLRYFYPPDPTETSATLGATVVTNASGSRTYRYGPTRDWVRGIRVMMMNGEVLDIPRGKFFSSPSGSFSICDAGGRRRPVCVPDYRMPRTKNTAGLYASAHMDLIDLFIGSEGALGIVTRVDVGLLPWKPKCSIIQFTDSDAQTMDLVEALREEKRLNLDFLEFYSENALKLLRGCQTDDARQVGMPPIPTYAKSAVFFELSFDPLEPAPDFAALLEVVAGCGASMQNSWAAYEMQELARFKLFRHLAPEQVGNVIAERKRMYPKLHRLSSDLAVPGEHFREMWEIYRTGLDRAGIEWIAFGHIGDNHIHVSSMPKDMDELARGLKLYEKFAEKAVDFGGTISAEHGIGKIKSKLLKIMYSREQLAQMRAVKSALDPEGLLNPGNIFDDS